MTALRSAGADWRLEAARAQVARARNVVGTLQGDHPSRPELPRDESMAARHSTSTATGKHRPAWPPATTIVARAMWALALVFMAIALLTTRSDGPNGGLLFAIVAVLAILAAITVTLVAAVR
jgi:hypothetical protein